MDVQDQSVDFSDKLYRCQDCCSWFAKPSELTAHILIAHADQSGLLYNSSLVANQPHKSLKALRTKCIKDSQPTRSKVPRKTQHKCSHCGRCFSQPQSLLTHLRCHNKGQTVSDGRKSSSASCQFEQHENSFTCDQCGKHFMRATYLKDHIKRHNRPFGCSECGRRFAQFTMLDRHMCTHTGEKRYECELCGRPFANADLLRKHRQTHANGRPFKPWVKPFGADGRFDAVLQRDAAERPYVCILCGDQFSRPGHLSVHMRSHSETNQPTIRCPKCSIAFHYESSLAQHMRKAHHVPTDDVDHTCTICHKRFMYLVDLSVHMISHSNEPMLACPGELEAASTRGGGGVGGESQGGDCCTLQMESWSPDKYDSHSQKWMKILTPSVSKQGRMISGANRFGESSQGAEEARRETLE